MNIIYWTVLIAFLVTIIVLIRSLLVKYKSEFILTKASEKISDGYLIFTSTGKITNFNKAIMENFDFSRKELMNKNVYEVFKGKEIEEEYINQIINACKDIKNSNETIRFNIKINKKIFEIEIKSIVNNDIYVRYVIICKDVTHSYEMIEELHNNQDLLANREKFATLGQLISRNSSFFENSNFCNFR